ncbi:MAG: PAS domain S-box protein [Planctomycetes bacterium]|nr:PAS domain S-box protein [Planctomycetota bacterium]
MEKTVSEAKSWYAIADIRGPWLLAVVGLIVFHLAWLGQGGETGIWLPGLGLGIVLASWLGWRILPVLTLDLLLARWQVSDGNFIAVLADSLVLSVHITLAWWLYHRVAHASRWLDDPRSATIFLILVPGVLGGAASVIQALLWAPSLASDSPFWVLAGSTWLARMTGILVLVPVLIVVATPILLRHRLLDFELPADVFGQRDGVVSRFGDGIELVGLTLSTTLLASLLLLSHVHAAATVWVLWASCLVLMVWTCIRQGVQGGCFSAGITSIIVLGIAGLLKIPPDVATRVQGNLLAFCSTALLVGVSASWIRANETRYRQVVSRIPFVVYGVRLPYGMAAANRDSPKTASDAKIDPHVGSSIAKLANVVLVSPACKEIFGCHAEALIGPFTRWLDKIVAEDHELVVAALTQLCLQKQAVTCEYRLFGPGVPSEADKSSRPRRLAPEPAYRWVRDSLTPHYSEDGLMDGWEGLVEDITEQRALSQGLRRMTNMLQVLVTNLPTGVYFVQAPQGFPILVNARARQLLGRREDLSSGLEQLSRVFRLHRIDGTEYPWEELPVAKALRLGVATRANDIVLHRADGRKVPLITWAAPIDLNNTGTPDAAVWVIEDWSAMQQAELALRESEIRLRAIIETMAEGVIVQDEHGAVLDGNAAACAILGLTRDQLLSRLGLTGRNVCRQEDGSEPPAAQQPDQQALKTGQPARNVILGLAARDGEPVKWLLVNSLPMPASASASQRKARLVTTFADITAQIHAQDSLRLTLDKYQNLVDRLPFMLLQRDKQTNITYLNPAATQLTGHSAEEMMRPRFCQEIIHPEDLARFEAAMASVGQGETSRIEARFYAKDKSLKTVLAFFQPLLHRGEVIGSTSLVIDITTQRRLEMELQQAKHLELVGRLASGTVHDFNNLLQVLMGTAGLAKLELLENHPVWQHLARIEEVGEQASHLAGQILTFSKQRPRQSRVIDLNALVAQTMKHVAALLPTTISVSASLAQDLPKALGDDGPIKQVVMNLLINARDAMPKGGKLTVRTDAATLPPADLHSGDKAWAHLAIQDTGIGMDDATRARVFEPFFSTKKNGTGLGLAVVQQIIKELGGIIEVCSQPGAGTRFDVWLLQAPTSHYVL